MPEVNAIKMELEEFRDAILNNTDTPVSVVDGFRAMDVTHQILGKNKQGRPQLIWCALLNSFFNLFEPAKDTYTMVYNR